MASKVSFHRKSLLFAALVASILLAVSPGWARDLDEIRESGVLRHIGVPYANFVTGSGDGLDVELIKLFAEHLGVRYEFVESDWTTVIADLTGREIRVKGDEVEVLGEVAPRGDIIANGLTILPWRQKVLSYSIPTFPTQIWLVARSDAPMDPIAPSGDVEKDIGAVRSLLKDYSVMGKLNTCLDPSLYFLEGVADKIVLFDEGLNRIAPAIINGEADSALLDVPDALIALFKWPGRIKIIGPLSPMQNMGCGLRQDSPELLQAFNAFYRKILQDGSYVELVKKYYPAVFSYYPDFFASPQ